ncbi:MAG: hypothetical protein V4563_14240 [Pseudomonadota bacterium]
MVFLTMLMLKDSSGVIQSSMDGLADAAKVTVPECKKSVKILLSPDGGDTSKVEGGRRIREVPGGWQIVNHDLYRFSTEAKREFWRAQKAEQRALEEEKKAKREKKRVVNNPTPEEQLYDKAHKNGDEKRCDEIVTESLPDHVKFGTNPP